MDDDLWALVETLLLPRPEKAPAPQPVADRLCLQGILYVLHNDIAWQTLPLELGFRLGNRPADGFWIAGSRPASSISCTPHPARRAECGRRTRLVPRVRGRLPHPRERGGADTGPSPVDRRKTGSKHHLICDGRGTPLKVITHRRQRQRRHPDPRHGRRHRVRGRTSRAPAPPPRLTSRRQGLRLQPHAFVSLACSLTYWRRLKRARS
ncbi:transposase [Streptomyces sp. NPDC093982]|uniref:transposase n=1 Tax=Streptomyces sp. NPDC093982 TaxID=3155077 RepID=UPI00344A810B